jgi:hypothetical protein
VPSNSGPKGKAKIEQQLMAVAEEVVQTGKSQEPGRSGYGVVKDDAERLGLHRVSSMTSATSFTARIVRVIVEKSAPERRP